MPLLEHLVDPPGVIAGFPLAARVLVDAGENGVYGVRLELLGDQAAWDTIQTRGLFGYSPAICGPIFGGAFHPELPYLVTISLREPHLSTVAALAVEPSRAWELVAAAPIDSAVRREESRVLLSVMQPRRPNVQFGMTTIWFEGGSP